MYILYLISLPHLGGYYEMIINANMRLIPVSRKIKQYLPVNDNFLVKISNWQHFVGC